MHAPELLELLQQGDEMEESVVGVLTEMLEVDLTHAFKLSPADLAEAREILKRLHDDSLKHKRMLDETKHAIQKGDVYDF